MCFWVSTVPAALLALLMEFCAESPHWLLKVKISHLNCFDTLSYTLRSSIIVYRPVDWHMLCVLGAVSV